MTSKQTSIYHSCCDIDFLLYMRTKSHRFVTPVLEDRKNIDRNESISPDSSAVIR